MDINIQAHQKVFTAHVMILEERDNNKIKNGFESLHFEK